MSHVPFYRNAIVNLIQGHIGNWQLGKWAGQLVSFNFASYAISQRVASCHTVGCLAVHQIVSLDFGMVSSGSLKLVATGFGLSSPSAAQ